MILLIIDAIRERQIKRSRTAAVPADDEFYEEPETEIIDDAAETDEEIREEDHPEEIVHDEPDYDTYSDDEPEYPEAAEESAMHTVRDVDAEETEKSEEQSGS